MNIDLIFITFSFIACLFWWFVFVGNIRSFFTISFFERETPASPKNWQKLSVVISACDEADTMEDAITTILKQNYPNLEVILVNDRSTDKTGQIIENFSKIDKRVKTLHISYLPDKWLGKIHALHEATKIVTGEWILYSDADVHFKQGTLRKAVALSISNKIDHLTLFPKIHSNSFLQKIVSRAFGLLFLQTIRILKFAGIGAFNLVRKEALEKSKGLQWLRMEIADDLGLGLLIHQSGGKNSYAFAFQNLSLTWYPSLGNMIEGLEKNMFSAAQYSFCKLIFMTISLLLIASGPILLFLYSDNPYFLTFGIITYCLMIISALTAKIKFLQTLLPSLFIQFGLVVFSYILLRSGVMCKLRGGIIWKGTKYKIEDLISGQRLK